MEHNNAYVPPAQKGCEGEDGAKPLELVKVPATQHVHIAGTGLIKVTAGVYYSLYNLFAGGWHIHALTSGGAASIEQSYRDFEAWVEREFHPETRLIVSGHSQGALVAAMYGALNPHRVAHVIAISPPFQGSAWARFFRFTASGRDMTHGSSFLQHLHDVLPALEGRLTTIGAKRDLLVSGHSCRLPGVAHLEVGAGHITEVLSPQLWRKIGHLVKQIEHGLVP